MRRIRVSTEDYLGDFGMRKSGVLLSMVVAIFVSVVPVSAPADTVITRAGASYSGQFLGAPSGTIGFTDSSGIQYTFPVRDVQSLVFTASNDTVTLRDGKMYSGTFKGGDSLSFKDNLGILYDFPKKDVESLVFGGPEAVPVTPPKNAKVIPTGTEITLRTDETIDSDNAAPGQKFSAEVMENIDDLSGGVAIPAKSPGKLLILSSSSGGAVHSPELVLDLDSVTIRGKVHRVYSSELTESNKKGVGANKRTAEMVGGGAAIGSLLGAFFGGGRGAAIGAATGGGGGLVTQLFTRGKKVKVPAEIVLHFRLERPLVLQPE
jgi:hypothetical protein